MNKYLAMWWCAWLGYDIAIKNLGILGIPLDVFFLVLSLALMSYFDDK